MKVFSGTLRFNTPAFLGGAEQEAVWRTPPIKALLRQFWRTAYAADCGFKVNVAEMRKQEGLLFGHAWLENDTVERNGRSERTSARKSLVRIRLESADEENPVAWSHGSQEGVEPIKKTSLPHSYAWFGLAKRGNGLPDRKAIRDVASNLREGRRTLHVAAPAEHMEHILTALALIDHFGLLGSRSRGGWGSLQIEGIEPLSAQQIQRHCRPLSECLKGDWPMSLASDAQGPCIWHSIKTFDKWDEAMKFIAVQRKEVRTALKNINGRDLRRALGFALKEKRMPSPLRWKIIPAANKHLQVRVFAMPHAIAEDRYTDVQTAWATVCRTLDGLSQHFTRTSTP